MTTTRYAGRVRAARPHLLELLATRPTWHADDLRAASELEEPVLQELLSDLLGDGTLRQRFIDPSRAVATGATYSLNTSLAAPALPPVLSPLQQKVMAYVVGRKVTLGDIGSAVNCPRSDLIEVLAFLESHDLVTCRYIGHLPIFSQR